MRPRRRLPHRANLSQKHPMANTRNRVQHVAEALVQQERQYAFCAHGSLHGCADRVGQLADLFDFHRHDLAGLEPALRLEAEADAKRSSLKSSHTRVMSRAKR